MAFINSISEVLNKILTIWYIIKYQIIMRNAVFGEKTSIRCRLIISGPGKVIIGNNCLIEKDPWGDDYVTIYTHRPNAIIKIGDNVTLRSTRFGSHFLITIGNCSVLEHASIFDSDFHNIDATKRDIDINKNDREVIIGEDCYVGCDCICSKGTVLCSGCILLPFSVIGKKSIPDDTMVCGYPGRSYFYPHL
jgi:acetyltransferase-like isoleucine patch superfamily enzyme